MAFGRTDRVETAAHRPQAWRASETPRAADPARPRFDALLPKAEGPKPVDDTADRTTDKTSDPPAADRREAASGAPRAGTDQGRTQTPRAANSPAKGRTDAADASGKDKDKDKAVAGDAAAPSTGGEAKADPAGQPAAAEAAEIPGAQAVVTGAVVPALAPVAPPVPPQPATPAPAAAVPAGTGTPQAGAIPAGAAPGGTAVAGPTGPAVDGDGDAGDVGEPGRAGTASKDFLAALSESGAAAGSRADPVAAPASAPAADAGAAVPSLSGQGLPSPAAGGTTAAAHAAATNPAAAAPPAVPIGQVPMTIGLRSLAGSSEFQIRLDPIELGRIEVKLEIDRAKGTVSTHLTVDRPDTLALLQRDAGQLQQALAQAGLDPGAGGVNLSLRQESGQQAGGQGGQGGGDGRPNTPWSADRADTLPEAVPVQRLRGYGGLDIRI